MTSHGAKKSTPFRSWFYFRTGYTQYFVYVFGVLNTLTLTFYLAVGNYPELEYVFPSFVSYVLIVCTTGIPLLILLGYVHMRRSDAFRSEVEVLTESDPYFYKLPPGIHREITAPFFYETLTILKKIDAGEKLNVGEVEKMRDLDENLDLLIGGGILKRPKSFGGL